MPLEFTKEKPSFLLFGLDCKSSTEAALLPPEPLTTTSVSDYREQSILSLSSARELALNHIQEEGKAKKVLSWLADLSLEEYGYILPKLLIDDFLGSGPHSIVYLGTYEGNEQVVVKVIDHDLHVSHEKNVLKIQV